MERKHVLVETKVQNLSYSEEYLYVDNELYILETEDTSDYKKIIRYVLDRGLTAPRYSRELISNMKKFITDSKYSIDAFKKDITTYCNKYTGFNNALNKFLRHINNFDSWEDLIKYVTMNNNFVLSYLTGIQCIMDHIYGTQKQNSTEYSSYPELKQASAYYDISYLLCSKLKGYSDMYFFANCGECSKIGGRIAYNLVRVAASRIFAEPHQAIVELIVNSADAYNTSSKKVGRFGMGFFSIMYFLLENPSRILTIESYYRENNIRKKLTLTIKNENDSLRFNIFLSNIKIDRTGTVLTIKGPFTETDQEKFIYYTAYTRFMNDNNLYIHSCNMVNQKSKKNIVYGVYNNKIEIIDYASGITLNTVLTSLLIPSSSTKGLVSGLSESKDEKVEADIINYKAYNDTNNNIFAITIKKVCIFYSHIDSPSSVIIHLPSDTIVPVTRDDIIIKEHNKRYMDTAFSILEKHIIKNKSLVPLEMAIESYTKKTNNKENANYMKNKLKEIIENIKREHVLIYYTHQRLFSINNYINRSDSSYIISKFNVDIIEIERRVVEKFVHEDYDSNKPLKKCVCYIGILPDIYVIILDNDEHIFKNKSTYTKLMTNRIVFINKDILENDKIPYNVINRLKVQYLLEENITIGSKKINANELKDPRYDNEIHRHLLLDRKISDSMEKYKDVSEYKRILPYIDYLSNTVYYINSNLDREDSIIKFLNNSIFAKLIVINLYHIYTDLSDKEWRDILYACKRLISNTMKYNESEISKIISIKDSLDFILYCLIILRPTKEKFIVMLEDVISSRIGYLSHYKSSGYSNNALRLSNHKITTVDLGLYIAIMSLERDLSKIVNMYLNDHFHKDMQLSNISDIGSYIRLFPTSVDDNILDLDYQKLLSFMYFWSEYFDDYIKEEIGLYVSLVIYISKNSIHMLNGRNDQVLIRDFNRVMSYMVWPVVQYCEIINLADISRYINSYKQEYTRQHKSLLSDQHNGLIYKYKNIFKNFNTEYKELYINKIRPYGMIFMSSNILSYTVVGRTVQSFIIKLLLKHIKIEEGKEMDIGYDYSIIPHQELIYDADDYDIRLSDLIKDAFIKDRVELDKIHQYDEDMDLQVIPIAIDSSTSKPDIEAVLIELFQNSRDAIISDNTVINNNIDIFSSLSEYEGKSILKLCIKDFVGMSLTNLITMFIPFYSSKKKNEKTTGEMGTGFFNVYRGVKEVSIKTAKFGKYYEILDKIEKENIYADVYKTKDISKNIKVYNCNENLRGTSITLIYEEDIKNNIENTYRKSILEYMIFNTLSYIIDDSVDIIYNNKGIKKSHYHAFNFSLYNISVYFVKDSISYLYTKCVPFSSLENFLENTFKDHKILNILDIFYKIGIMINLRDNVYEPIQSRSKILFSDLNKEHLLEVIEKMIPRIIIRNICKNNDIDIISMQSIFYGAYTASIDQVYPIRVSSCDSLQDYFFQYTYKHISKQNIDLLDEMNEKIKNLLLEIIDLKNNNMLTYIDITGEESHDRATNIPVSSLNDLREDDRYRYIDTVVEINSSIINELHRDMRNTYSQLLYSNEDRELIELSIDIIKEWFKPKIIEMYKSLIIGQEENKDTDVLERLNQELNAVDNVVLNVVTYFLNSYTNIYIQKIKALRIEGSDSTYTNFVPHDIEIPLCGIRADLPGNLGYYVPSLNVLIMAYPNSFDNSIMIALKDAIIKNDPTAMHIYKKFNTMFNSISQSTIGHEIEHWRRQDSHSDNHSSLINKIVDNEISTSNVGFVNVKKERDYAQFIEYTKNFISISDIIISSFNETHDYFNRTYNHNNNT
jgi:hypothetical protein